MIDKEFLLEELRERIKFLRSEERWEPSPEYSHVKDYRVLIYRERRHELERLVRQIESGIYDKEAAETMSETKTLENQLLNFIREKGGSITLDDGYDIIDLAYDLDCQIEELNDAFRRLLYEQKINVTLEVK